MYLLEAASAERLNAAQNNDECALEEKLKRACSHEEEIRLLMEYRRQAPKKESRSKDAL